MKDVLGNRLKDRLFQLVHWLRLPSYCKGPVKNPSILKERLTWIVPRSGENLEGWRTGCRPWGVETMDASEIYSIRLDAKEVIFPKEKRRIYFSNRRWTNQPPWRRSRPENTHFDTAGPVRGESHLDFLRESEGSLPPPHDSFSDAGEAINDFGPCQETSKPPSRWTQSQTLLAERRIIPYPTEIHWCIQNYSNEFGCQAGETHRWLLEYRWVKRLVGSLDRFHSIYSIGRKTFWRIYVVRVEINEKTADIQARSFMARTLEVNGKARQAEGEAKVVEWKAPSGERTKIARDLFHWPGG